MSMFPREEGFRQFVRSLGRRYRNPYSASSAAHSDYASGWRDAALLCGQPHLAAQPEGATDRAVVVKRRYDRGLMPPMRSVQDVPRIDWHAVGEWLGG
ncbi:MAG TPA: hypothetical protein VFM34_02695 [Moraxellaceae bacterium]|nr:hypothetical protein [Moraxellaceae bacterium]